MEQQYASLDDHIRLLKRKGYTEAGLDLGSPSGMIAKVLRDVYRKVSLDVQGSQKPESFVLIIPARFDKRLDDVEFRINYRYNPGNGLLRISSMAADMGEIKKLMLVTQNGQIDHAQQVYQDLSSQRAKKVLQQLANRKVNPIVKKNHL